MNSNAPLRPMASKDVNDENVLQPIEQWGTDPTYSVSSLSFSIISAFNNVVKFVQLFRRVLGKFLFQL